MATAAAGSKRAYKQDLPPKGGYAPFNYHRIPARKMYTGIIVNIPFLNNGDVKQTKQHMPIQEVSNLICNLY